MSTEAWIPVDTFGTRLFIIRKQKQLTVEAIAKMCGVAHPTWTTWENGAKPRDLVGAIEKISKALGVDKQWLMWGGALGGSEPAATDGYLADSTVGSFLTAA